MVGPCSDPAAFYTASAESVSSSTTDRRRTTSLQGPSTVACRLFVVMSTAYATTNRQQASTPSKTNLQTYTQSYTQLIHTRTLKCIGLSKNYLKISNKLNANTIRRQYVYFKGDYSSSAAMANLNPSRIGNGIKASIRKTAIESN